MTDLQIRYQQMMEQKRSNLANESIKTRDLDINERESYARIVKMSNEIAKIQADTELSKAQKQKAIAETVNTWMDTFIKPLKATADTAKALGPLLLA